MTAVLPQVIRDAKAPIEVWHQDGTRVGQQGTLTYVWADKGRRPAALRDQRRQSACLFSAVCADRGVHVATGAHAVVMLDGAGWHQTGGRLQVPGNVSLLRLPHIRRN